MSVKSMTGESPVERQAWLYRELYGLPCRVTGARIILSASDVCAIEAPCALAALIDDELFWSKKVTPILNAGTGSPTLILLAAPTPVDPTSCAATLRRRAQCEFLPPGRQITLPAPRPSTTSPTLPTPRPSGATPTLPASLPSGAIPVLPEPLPHVTSPTLPAPFPSGATPALPAPLAPADSDPHWFRYPQCETLQPLTAVLRAIRIVLRDLPRTYPT